MSTLKGIISGIIATSTFGLIPLFAIPAMEGGIGVNSLLFYRFGISALILGVILKIKHVNLRISFTDLGIISILGTLAGSTAIILTSSYLYIPSGIATTIHFLYPVIVTIIMILFFHDKVIPLKILAVLLAVCGVILLTNTANSNELNFKGIVLALTTTLTYAMYFVGVQKSSVSQMNGLKLTFYVLLVSTILFAINLLIRREALDIPTKETIIPVLLLALLPTVVSDTLLIIAIQNVGSTTTSILGCMEPLTTVIIGYFVFQEKIGLVQGLGILAIILAITFIILSNPPKIKSNETQIDN